MVNGFPSHLRTERIIQEIIAPVMSSLVANGIVTVSKVDVTSDKHKAVIHYTVIGADAKDTHELLTSKIYYIRTLLAKNMKSHHVPQIELSQLPIDMPNLSCMGS